MKNISAIICILLLCLVNSFAQTPTPTPATVDGNGNTSLKPPTSTESKIIIPKSNVETPGAIYVGKDSPAPIPRFETAPVIDGQLNDAVWQNAAVFGDFLQIQPGDNVAPRVRPKF